MRYIDEFRNPDAARALRTRIAERAAALEPAGRPVAIMEVCGSHTMAIARYGIRTLVPANVRLISGPGCPVCVTDAGYIDAAMELAGRGVTVATFGDMLNVPGSAASLAQCRAAGGDVAICYSPTTALDLARQHPEREVVFLAIGFETTIAPLAALVAQTAAAGVRNLTFLTAFKTVPPALQALRADPEIRIDAFLCPAHVSAIIGANAYRPFVGPGGVPCVIAGFEPLDILLGLDGILAQIVAGEARIENQYSRVVKDGGNPMAQAAIARCLQPCGATWRGLGTIPASGLELRPEYDAWNAARKHGVTVRAGRSHPGCRCGDVLKGKCEPPACRLFGTGCTPDHPVGPCMVSVEGTCAAWFKYAQRGMA